MTDVVPFTPTGHPVRRFVAALVVFAVVGVLVGWTGIANPRLDSSPSYLEQLDGVGEATVEVRNGAPLGVTIEGATALGDGVVEASLVRPVEVPGGGSVDLTLRVTLQCSEGPGPEPGVRLDVRTWSGLHRDVDVRSPLFDVCR